MKKNLFERLRAWDQGEFDLTDGITEQRVPEPPAGDEGLGWDPSAQLTKLENRQIEGFNRFYPWMAGLLCAVMIGFLLLSVLDLPPFGDPGNPTNNQVTERYLARGTEETGAVNVVTGVILDYRAFDTLGESHVLYAAFCAVMILLSGFGSEPEPERLRRILEEDPVLRRTARVLVPIILLFGCYVVLTGHLGPGGGFSGGAILGSGMILCAMSFGFASAEKLLRGDACRAIVTAALSFYSLSKCYSFFCGANRLQTVFTPGTPGRILSAGLILPLNVAVGLVVGCTMYGFYSIFIRGRI